MKCTEVKLLFSLDVKFGDSKIWETARPIVADVAREIGKKAKNSYQEESPRPGGGRRQSGLQEFPKSTVRGQRGGLSAVKERTGKLQGAADRGRASGSKLRYVVRQEREAWQHAQEGERGQRSGGGG